MSDEIPPVDDLVSVDFHSDKWVRLEATEQAAQHNWDRMRSKYVSAEPLGKLIWVAIDLDGTLAEGIWTPDNPTSEIGDPIWANVEKAREVEAAGYKIIIHTSRGWADFQNIEGWLNHYNIPFRSIVCGKLLAVLYVDDRGRHADAESWLP